MKRREDPADPAPVDGAGTGTGDELTDFNLWCSARGVPQRGARGGSRVEIVERQERRYTAWQAWRAARVAHDAEHGWPGGEAARVKGERQAHPGTPFPFEYL